MVEVSSPSVSPTTRTAPSLPFDHRSKESLDSSAAGTVSSRWTETPQTAQSTAATSLVMDEDGAKDLEHDNTVVEKGDDEEGTWEMRRRNILAWL